MGTIQKRHSLASEPSFEIKRSSSLTPTIMERFAIVRGPLPKQLRRQIGELDMLIAATALVNDLTLVTRNTRDFQHIPGLKIFEPDTAD